MLTTLFRNFSLLVFLIFVSCSGLEESEKEKIRTLNASGEHIYRASGEILFPIEEPKRVYREPYSWEDSLIGNQIKITKEYFRCKGSSQSPPLCRDIKGQPTYSFDCGGMNQHSLPLRDEKEFVYPILLDLLNYIQGETMKKVVITCGHRCPTHNAYSDTSLKEGSSKHMMSAEVDFYVKGLEWSPEKVVALILQYYQANPEYTGQKGFTEFLRYEKGTNVSTLPWYNKEIFIKIFKKDEGRDLDNSHKFPYVSIQVKWDRDTGEAVTYSWAQAFNGYLRY